MPDTDLGNGWIRRQLPEGEYTYPSDGSQFMEGGLAPLVKAKPLTLTDIAPQQGTVQTIIDNLLGINGRSRYKTWHEKMLRNIITAPHDAVNRNKPKNNPDLHSEGLDLQDEHLNDLRSGKPVHVSGHMLVPIEGNPHELSIGLSSDNYERLSAADNARGVEVNRSNGGRADLNNPISSGAAPHYGIRPAVMDQLLPEYEEFQPNSIE
jgi:hypothetical protein